MTEIRTTIDTSAELKQILDYKALRELGMKYIEQLGHNFWTDYNSHDPGITMLEVLCYALTELGYRMQFPMQDILAPSPGETKPENSNFSAREILTTDPITQLDQRKYLIDLPGISNAWIQRVTDWQPAVYADCRHKSITFEPTDHPIAIQGLSDVLVEFEFSEQFGDLNSAKTAYTIPSGVLKGLDLEFFIHQRPDVSWQDWMLKDLEKVEILSWDKTSNTRWEMQLKYVFGKGTDSSEHFFTASLLTGKIERSNPDNALMNQIRNTGTNSLQSLYLERERYIIDVLKMVERKLHACRNLCEDFRYITLVPTEEVSFCADIQAAADADLEAIEAELIFVIEQYLSPKVEFQTLLELQEAGYRTEEIFNGPALEHGFLTDESVKEGDLREHVYTSDIINLIMDIEGVQSVSNFVMSHFASDGSVLRKSEAWALHLSKGHKPVYSSDRSKWLFLKNGIPFSTRNSEVADILDLLKAEYSNGKLLGQVLDLAQVPGRNRNLGDYFSIQNDFPLVYGVGRDGYPANADLLRLNQIRQLQGYLQFFDQILADFLYQVQKFKEYISLEKSVEHTYFSRYLTADELPAGSSIYADVALLQTQLPRLAESEELFALRRNRVLDHLLGRFQESFSDYVLKLYDTSSDTAVERDLIDDKIEFLKNYPRTSKRRFCGVDILRAWNWPYEPSAGLTERVSHKSGLPQPAENWLLALRFVVKRIGPEADDKWRVIWTDRLSGVPLMRSVNDTKGKENAIRNARQAFQLFLEGRFRIKPAGSKYRLLVGNAFRSGNLFSSESDASEFALQLLESLNTGSEGLNLIEHILLRPHSNSYRLMDACIPDDCQFCGEEDPYSFRLSVVLPYWPARFRDMDYRRYLNELIRTDCPAHILPRICWADPFTWQELEEAWHHWLVARKGRDHEARKEANARLITALEAVETVYPEALLHDCEDDRDENPVILNQTKLGTF